MNSMVATPPPPAMPGDDAASAPEKPRNDNGAITVAAPAASLIMVLVAIVLWFFLVRRQLRRNAKKLRRRLHNESFAEGHGRHYSAKAFSRLSPHGSPHGTPRSHRKLGGSPKDKHHSCNCTVSKHKEKPRGVACTCGAPHHDAKPTANGVSTVCTGNSPFCPHSNRMKHHADIHSCGSSIASLDLNDMGPPGLPARGRANTGDYTTLTKPAKAKRDGPVQGGALRRPPAAAAGCWRADCTCHPLNGLERKPCSCSSGDRPSSHARRKCRDDINGLYFSAPSLVHKQTHNPC